jgi:hypothetical protein
MTEMDAARSPLARPMHWRIKPGASAVPSVHTAGLVLWAMAACMALAWWLALLLDARAGLVEPLALGLASLLASAWLVLAWRAAKRWRTRPEALTLVWRGPVKRRASRQASSSKRSANDTDTESGGFAIAQWQVPVHVHRLLDWQKVVLVRIHSVPSVGGAREAYCWLHANDYPAELPGTERIIKGSFHALRTLLQLPPSMTRRSPAEALAQAKTSSPARQVLSAMASWRLLSKSGATLRASLSAHPKHDSSHPGSFKDQGASLFPPTVLLSASERCSVGELNPGGRS